MLVKYNMNAMNADSLNRTKKLRVAVFENALPYSNCKPPIFEGITVDIWKKVAEKYNLEYEFICYKREYDNALVSLNNNEIDVLVADVSVISRRYNLALYSRPFFISDIHIYRKNNNSSILEIFKNDNVKNILLIVFLIIIFYTFLIMYIMKLNFLDAYYKTFLSFLTVGGEIIPFKNKTINSYNIKIVNSVWALILFFFRTFIITRIISSIVMNKNFISIDELEQVDNVNVLKGSAYIDYVKQIGKTPVEVATTAEIIDKLKNSNGSEYWFDDTSIVISELKKSNVIMQLDRTERPILNDEYAIAVNKRLPEVLNMINTTLINMQNSGEMLRICKGYLTDNYDKCLL